MVGQSGVMSRFQTYPEGTHSELAETSPEQIEEQLICGTNGWFRDVWQYRELLFFLAWRDFRLRYRQTFLGIAWALIQPVFTMLVFTVLFGTVVKVPSDNMPYPVFYYAGLLPWIYFSSVVALSAVSLLGNASLITKVYFPRVFLPASPALTGLVDLGISSTLLVGMLLWYGVPFTSKLALWPGLIILLFTLTLSIGTLLAACNVRYRDIKHALPLLIQLWLYATPIIYPLSLVPDRFRLLVLLNPLTGIVQAFRASCSPAVSVDWTALAVSVVVIGLLFVVSIFYFTKVEREFADLI
jgi:lipopolysaccharide transport system permease protein